MKISKPAKAFAVLLAVALLICAGCKEAPSGHDHGHSHGAHGEHEAHGEHAQEEAHQHDDSHHEAEEAEPIARTELSGKLLNFFEFAPLKPQQVSSFLIHLTELSTGKPVAKADVKLVIKGANGKELDVVQAKVGRVTGIYVAEVKIPVAGTYGIDFVVKNDQLQDTMALLGFEVSETPPAAGQAEEEAPAETVAFLMEQQWLIDMKLAQAEAKELAVPIHSTGRIIPAANNHARISSPVSGTLTGRNLPLVGTRVEQGQAVATVIETSSASERAQVRAALAQVEAARVQTSAQLQSGNANIANQNAQARIENARLRAEKKALAEQFKLSTARLNQAKKESERAKKVYAVEGISTKELQTVELKLREAQADLQQVQAKKQALDKVGEIPINPLLTETAPDIRAAYLETSRTVTAPFFGVVTEVHKSLGEQVVPGEAILEIANTETVWLNCPVYEKDLGALHEGVEVSFTVLSHPGRDFTGSLVHVGEVIDEKTRATDALFKVSNEEQLLKLGMQAKVRIAGERTARTVVIPREAVLDRESKKVVYVLVTGEEFERRTIEVSEDFGSRIGVSAGLSPGERVVTQGAYQLFLQETNPGGEVPHSHET